MKSKNLKLNSEVRATMEEENSFKEHAELRQVSSMLNQLSKQHQKAKELLSEAQYLFSLLKAILKYEKKTTTRPEEIYLENVKKRLDENLGKLKFIYDPNCKRD